jgi:hypothetical protein
MAPCKGQENFEANLQGRSRAAKGLERDLLTEVPCSTVRRAERNPKAILGSSLQQSIERNSLAGTGAAYRLIQTAGTDNALPFERAITFWSLRFC